MRTIRSRRAISPVIATVILVAVAITVAVAVAYWMGGIAGQYTKFEKVEIQNAKCMMDTYGNWNITLTLKNSGTSTATLIGAYVNEQEVAVYNATEPGTALTDCQTNMTQTPSYTIESGESLHLNIWVGVDYATLSSGTTVNVKLHSAGGMDYIKLVELV